MIRHAKLHDGHDGMACYVNNIAVYIWWARGGARVCLVTKGLAYSGQHG